MVEQTQVKNALKVLIFMLLLTNFKIPISKKQKVLLLY